MMRGKRAPSNFECPYKDHCPHLEGLSTQWVWGEYQRSYEEHQEHWKVRDIQEEQIKEAWDYIDKLEKENAELKAKYQALHRRQFQKRKKEKTKPASGSPIKKRGARQGHPGWFRPEPGHVDKIVVVETPTICPHCCCDKLSPVEEMKDHLQEDIVFEPRTHVTNFKHHQAYCPKCHRPVVQAGQGELIGSHIGPKTKALSVYLRYGLNIPYRKVQELFSVLFNMSFVPASAIGFERKATRMGEPLYEDLKEKLRQSIIVHADETHWREDGKNAYVWYGGNKDMAFFHIDKHRSSEVAQSILGNQFQGALITDGYAAYNAVNAQYRQSCLAHILRKVKEIQQEILLKKPKYQDKTSLIFCKSIEALIKKACSIGKKFIEGQIPRNRSNDFKKRFYSLLYSICAGKLMNPKAETLRLRLLDPRREYNRLFTFLECKDVQPTNNQAEQSLRNMVIFRKICFGTRSAEGSYSHSVLPSLLLTAKRQIKQPLDFFMTLFTSDTDTAQKFLFNNSS